MQVKSRQTPSPPPVAGSLAVESGELCRRVAEKHDTVIVSFSCGKDSVGAWLQARRHFKRVVPVFMYKVPGLEFQELTLARYEQQFGGERIRRYPHPALYKMLSNGTLQTPRHNRILGRVGLPTFTVDELFALVKQTERLPADTPVINGSRAADNPRRRAHFGKSGAYNHKRHVLYAVWDWTASRLVEEINAAGIKLGPEYLVFGRSFDGLSDRYLIRMAQCWPEDYQQVLRWFPMAGAMIARGKLHGEASFS